MGGGVDGFQFECTDIVFYVFLVDASIHNKNNRPPPPPPVCLLLDFTFSLVFNSESQFTLSLHILKEKPYAPSPTHPNGQRLEVTWLIASNSAILNNSNHLLKG